MTWLWLAIVAGIVIGLHVRHRRRGMWTFTGRLEALRRIIAEPVWDKETGTERQIAPPEPKR